jgi:hypothetical protein
VEATQPQYTDADDFATVRKGMVNTEFFKWYRRKVLNRCDSASLKSATRKFFKFLAEEKGIRFSPSHIRGVVETHGLNKRKDEQR